MNTLLKNEIEEMNDVMREEVTGFKVTNLESANWCFRKIRALQEQISSNKALADAERIRIQAWENKENESAKDSIDYFESLLTEYYMANKELDKKFKLSTPYGKVSSRKSKTWKYENEELTIDYLKKNEYSDLIKIKESLNKTELKKAFKDGVNKETGEVLPGVNIEETESISIKAE